MGRRTEGADESVNVNLVLSSITRQMAELEEKIDDKMRRGQQQGERQRKLDLARLEARLVAAETSQPRVERRLSELFGQVRGLCDEAQVQSRRVDQVDTRLQATKQELQRDMQTKFSQLREGHQQATSVAKWAATNNDNHLRRLSDRLRQLEIMMDEQVHQALKDDLVALDRRLDALEAGTATAPLAPASVAPAPLAPSSAEEARPMEKVVNELRRFVEGATLEWYEAQVRIAAHAERLKTLMVTMEGEQDLSRGLEAQVLECDTRSKNLEEAAQELRQNVANLAGRLDTVEHVAEQALRTGQAEEVEEPEVAHLLEAAREAQAPPSQRGAPSTAMPMEEVYQAVMAQVGNLWEGQMSRMQGIEEQLAALGDQAHALADSDAARRAAASVEDVAALGKRVSEHDATMRGVLEWLEEFKTMPARLKALEEKVEELLSSVHPLASEFGASAGLVGDSTAPSAAAALGGA